MNEAVWGENVSTIIIYYFWHLRISQISESDMLSLEGTGSYWPDYTTSAHLLCWGSQVGNKPNKELDMRTKSRKSW